MPARAHSWLSRSVARPKTVLKRSPRSDSFRVRAPAPSPSEQEDGSAFARMCQSRGRLGIGGATGFKASTLATIWNAHHAGLHAAVQLRYPELMLAFFMVRCAAWSLLCAQRVQPLFVLRAALSRPRSRTLPYTALAQLTQPCFPARDAQVFVYMNHLPKVDSWSAHMAFIKFGVRNVYSQSTFWCHAKKIIWYLSNNIDELELNMRDDPYNHGTGELAYRVKEIVDTFPLYIKSRNIDCQNTKYKGFVLKFQLMCTFSGRITRLSRPYCGRVSDATIFNLEHDGAPHIVLGDKAYIGCFQCLTAAKGMQPENVRLRNRHLNYYR